MSSGDLPDIDDDDMDDDGDWRQTRAYLLCAAGLAAIVFVAGFAGLVWMR